MRLEQLVAPLDRRAQRSLPVRRITRARRQERQPPVEPRQKLIRVQERHARCRQLDRERQPVKPSADLADRDRRHESSNDGTCALDEEGFSIVGRQWFDRVPLFGRDVQRLAARDKDIRVRCALEQRRDHRRGLDNLLEVVHQDEQALARHVLDQVVVCADRGADRTLDESGIAERLQRNPEHTVRELFDCLGRKLKPKTRLAASTRPRQRHEPGSARKRTIRSAISSPFSSCRKWPAPETISARPGARDPLRPGVPRLPA